MSSITVAHSYSTAGCHAARRVAWKPAVRALSLLWIFVVRFFSLHFWGHMLAITFDDISSAMWIMAHIDCRISSLRTVSCIFASLIVFWHTSENVQWNTHSNCADSTSLSRGDLVGCRPRAADRALLGCEKLLGARTRTRARILRAHAHILTRRSSIDTFTQTDLCERAHTHRRP